jgi:hydroxymethylpyrimidine pyrophosphatase-like HAD family hydrolase
MKLIIDVLYGENGEFFYHKVSDVYSNPLALADVIILLQFSRHFGHHLLSFGDNGNIDWKIFSTS